MRYRIFASQQYMAHDLCMNKFPWDFQNKMFYFCIKKILQKPVAVIIFFLDWNID